MAEDVSAQHVRRLDVSWHEQGDRVVITRPKFGRFGTALLRLFRVRPELTLRLDPLGSAVWRLLDGRTVGQVLAELERTHGDEPDLPQRLGRYLGTLASNRLISLSSAGTTR